MRDSSKPDESTKNTTQNEESIPKTAVNEQLMWAIHRGTYGPRFVGWIDPGAGRADGSVDQGPRIY